MTSAESLSFNNRGEITSGDADEIASLTEVEQVVMAADAELQRYLAEHEGEDIDPSTFDDKMRAAYERAKAGDEVAARERARLKASPPSSDNPFVGLAPPKP